MHRKTESSANEFNFENNTFSVNNFQFLISFTFMHGYATNVCKENFTSCFLSNQAVWWLQNVSMWELSVIFKNYQKNLAWWCPVYYINF